MGDRELLELAAKAAGVEIVEWRDHAMTDGGFGAMLTQHGTGARTWWNPLTDDGDALRLAVKLHIDFKCYAVTVRAWIGDPVAQKVLASVEELCGTDPYAATRRAIVRAAAEIGKAMTPSTDGGGA